MNNTYDVIVIGLGIMGAASLRRVATKCSRVISVDASGPTHSYGSSQGNSRIFRRAYWEGEKYLPLLNHADSLWNELEGAGSRQLLYRTGGIFIGPQSSRIVAGSVATANSGRIEHSVWTSSKTVEQFPAFNVLSGMQAVYEPGAYAISACDSRLTMLNEAVRLGALVEFGDPIVHLENRGTGVHVTTKSGRTYSARTAIVTVGPWISDSLMQELKTYVEPRQVPLYWFKPKVAFEDLFSPKHFPVFLYELQDGGLLYGVPSITSSELGVKIGFHNRQQTPATADWTTSAVQQRHLEEISEVVGALFPELERSSIQAKNCFYTMSQDESFLIGESQVLKSTYFASACSGHGFKFAPAIGDALANMAVGQEPNVSLSAFSVGRFESASRQF